MWGSEALSTPGQEALHPPLLRHDWADVLQWTSAHPRTQPQRSATSHCTRARAWSAVLTTGASRSVAAEVRSSWPMTEWCLILSAAACCSVACDRGKHMSALRPSCCGLAAGTADSARVHATGMRTAGTLHKLLSGAHALLKRRGPCGPPPRTGSSKSECTRFRRVQAADAQGDRHADTRAAACGARVARHAHRALVTDKLSGRAAWQSLPQLCSWP